MFLAAAVLAVAEAVERGLTRREQEGKDIETMGPVCTIMVGRLDDWLKVVADKQDISVDPGVLEWAGLAVFKKTYGLFQERRYRLRLLSAAFRNHMHWSELIGGDVVISPPHAWQKRFNACDVAVEPRIDKPIAPEILTALNKFADFRRASTSRGSRARIRLLPADAPHAAPVHQRVPRARWPDSGADASKSGRRFVEPVQNRRSKKRLRPARGERVFERRSASEWGWGPASIKNDESSHQVPLPRTGQHRRPGR